MQCKLIRTLCDLAADLDQRRILQVDTHARNSRQFRTQIFDDCFDIFLSLVHRLQDDQNVPGVAGGADVAKADGREDTDYVRILANEIDDLILMPRHFSEGNSFGSLRVADNLAGIVVRDEAFRNNVEERNRDQKQHAANCERQRAIFQSNLQRPAVPANQPFVSAFGGLPKSAMLGRTWSAGILARIFALRWERRHPACIFARLCTLPHGRVSALMTKCFQNPAAKHWGETQRNKA